MKFLTTIILLSTSLLSYAATIPDNMDASFSLESRDTCSSPPGVNGCGGGRECGKGAGIYTCSPSGQIVAIACCGPNGCKEINGQPYCV